MSRKTEILSRNDFFACCPADLVEQMTNELAAWDGGDTCDQVECTTDSLGHIDSESSPRPATRGDETVCNKQIQHDNSGVGHNWRKIDRNDIPAAIIEEIEGEIIDGKMDECDDFVGSNGLHYRW